MSPPYDYCRKCGRWDTDCVCGDAPLWVYVLVFILLFCGPITMCFILRKLG